jgi:hypothetical protein
MINKKYFVANEIITMKVMLENKIMAKFKEIKEFSNKSSDEMALLALLRYETVLTLGGQN